jgi:reactive intermediate/imine deaminase
MSGIKRYGAGKFKVAGVAMPFVKAAEANGWLFVSGQVPMEDGEIIEGGIVPQIHKTIQNLLAILDEAGYKKEHILRCGVWLDDPRDFGIFNKIYGSYFGGEHAPARACVQAVMMVDCKVEIECVCYKDN